VELLSGTESIETFYSYGSPSGSSSNTGLEESETSLLFLYKDETTGDVSLAFIHDIAPDATGGSAQFSFSGIPADAEFVVRDDAGEVPSGPIGDTAVGTWTWSPCCTDGGALSPLGSEFEITITPTSFSGITAWKYLTSTDPIALDLGLRVTIKAELVSVCENQQPVAAIAEIADATIELPVTVEVTPQALNLGRLGKWVKVHICEDGENTSQGIDVTLDGSGSYDPDGDTLASYDWTLTGPSGDIPVAGNVVKQDVTLSSGSYTVTLVVNDGKADSVPFSETFTISSSQTIDDLATHEAGEFTLNGVPAVELKRSEDCEECEDCIVLSFADDAIAATVSAGMEVEMTLAGPGVSGVDYIKVIDGKAGKAGKASAPGQNKEPGESAVGKGKG